jgi:hypothetical protein
MEITKRFIGTLDEDEGSTLNFWYLESSDFFGDRTEDEEENVTKAIREYGQEDTELAPYRCGCEHDCCGHYQRNSISIIGFNGVGYIVQQIHFRNI